MDDKYETEWYKVLIIIFVEFFRILNNLVIKIIENSLY